MLLSEDREEANWEKAKRDYELVQTSIIRGDSLELFGDVDRLLPDHIKPKCMESNMAIEEYVRDTKPTKALALLPKATKRKRNAEITRNIPEGAHTGFISSAKLIPKGNSKKRKVAPREYGPDIPDDDDDDRAIQLGIHGSAWIDSKSERKGRAKPKSLKKQTRTGPSGRKRRAPLKSAETTLSQLDREVEDDTDDMEIELGLKFSSPERPLANVRASKRRTLSSPSTSPIFVHPSPEALEKNSGRWSSAQPHQPSPVRDHSWLLDSDGDIPIIEKTTLWPDSRPSAKADPLCTTPKDSFTFKGSPLSHIPMEKIRRSQTNMLALSVPVRAPTSSDAEPEPSFAVRPPGMRRKCRRMDSISSSPARHPPSNKPQHSSPAPSPTRPSAHKKQRRRKPSDLRELQPFLDLEAEVSGDDVPGGSTDTDGSENETDRR